MVKCLLFDSTDFGELGDLGWEGNLAHGLVHMRPLSFKVSSNPIVVTWWSEKTGVQLLACFTIECSQSSHSYV